MHFVNSKVMMLHCKMAKRQQQCQEAIAKVQKIHLQFYTLSHYYTLLSGNAYSIRVYTLRYYIGAILFSLSCCTAAKKELTYGTVRRPVTYFTSQAPRNKILFLFYSMLCYVVTAQYVVCCTCLHVEKTLFFHEMLFCLFLWEMNGEGGGYFLSCEPRIYFTAITIPVRALFPPPTPPPGSH